MGMTKIQSRKVAMLAACSAILGAIVSAGGAAEAQVVVQGQAGISVGATGYAQPPPVYQQPQVVYQQQPQVVYQQQPVVYQQQQLVLARPTTRRGNVGRFRYGIDGGVGWQFMDYTSGFNLNASIRLGWQLNDQIAIYYQSDIPIGIVSGRSPGGVEVSGASIIWGNAVMFEYTLNDIVSFGIGPSADIGAGRVGDGSASVGAAGTFFGIQSRIAFNLMPSAESNPYRRAGFRVGLGGHTTFMGGTVVQSLTVLLGWELM